MESLFFEDQDVADMHRQVSGMTQNIHNTLDTVSNAMAKTQVPTTDSGNKPYPLGTVDKVMADAFMSLLNTHKLLDDAKANPLLRKKSKKIRMIQDKLKKINQDLVVISELVDNI
jgi:hypothetical protein